MLTTNRDYYCGPSQSFLMDTNNVHSFPEADDSQDTTPQEGQEITWEIVAKTPGITVAEIIAGRLQSEGIPAEE